MTTDLTAVELAAVADAMAAAGEALVGPLQSDLIAGGRSNLTYRLTDGERRWVMRRPPRAGRTPSAHDVAREFKVTQALAATGVPVPRAVVLHEDEVALGGPFAIADFVDGTCIQTEAQLDRVDVRTVDVIVADLVDVLAALHQVDHVGVGLERFGRPDAYAERQLHRWATQWETVGTEALGGLGGEVIRLLGKGLPEQRRVGIVHGDYRIDNTLLAVDGLCSRVAAVVDWELCTIGDPAADVAMMCAYRDQAFDLIVGERSAWTSARLPDAASLAARYEQASGQALVDFGAHLALAHFKVAVIAAGIAHRVRAGAGGGAGFDTAGEAVESYLEAALRYAL